MYAECSSRGALSQMYAECSIRGALSQMHADCSSHGALSQMYAECSIRGALSQMHAECSIRGALHYIWLRTPPLQLCPAKRQNGLRMPACRTGRAQISELLTDDSKQKTDMTQ